MGERPARARACADAVRRGLERYLAERARITSRARGRFERREWAEGQQDARERLDLRERVVQAVVAGVAAELGGSASDRVVWREAKERYAADVEPHPAAEIARSFFNSIGRRVLGTVGVEPAVEFLGAERPAPEEGPEPVFRAFERGASTAALFERILRAPGFAVPWEDLARDARLAASELDAHLREGGEARPVDRIEVAAPVFFRGKGAYLVGRVLRGRRPSPVVLAILHGARGLHLDAALFGVDDASIVFSFTRSYFHVHAPRPRALVAFLSSILPAKRVSELYIALGFHKHGKTELWGEVSRHLAGSSDRLEPARGARGLVMIVFTLPGLDVVFKVIRDDFPPPKQATRAEIMAKYRHVFRHDRAGRLVDAQEFEHVSFPADRFSAPVLEELRRTCPLHVRERRRDLSIAHLYVERRVTPLDLLVREADEWTARQAVLDYGQALRDLAATDTFPGDLLLKNFGVTRHGRVISYDYDELERVTACAFRDLPAAVGGDADVVGGEASFYVGPRDVFPGELLPFIGFQGRLRDVFLQAHGDLLGARWWREVQDRIRSGEIVDIFPYRDDQRLHHAR